MAYNVGIKESQNIDENESVITTIRSFQGHYDLRILVLYEQFEAYRRHLST